MGKCVSLASGENAVPLAQETVWEEVRRLGLVIGSLKVSVEGSKYANITSCSVENSCNRRR